MRAEEAWAKAADCAARAEDAADEQARILFNKLRDSWIRVANHCEFLEAPQANARTLPVQALPVQALAATEK